MKDFFEEREERVNQQALMFPLFGCHPPLSLPKRLRTPMTSYLVSFLR